MTSKEKIKYYIIKDLDTGLYYRGKGQNRWGKYYNQASIFRNLAQAHNSVEELKRYYKSNAVAIEIEINEQTNTSFEECIKEWEKRGWKVDEDGYFKTITFIKGDRGICFDIEEKYYFTFQPSLETNSFDIDVELHNLIHKTLKALEVKKNECNE